MKYLETKHEKKAVKVTALLTLILVLLLFFITSPPYIDPPQEYGFAINLDYPSKVDHSVSKFLTLSPKNTTRTDVVKKIELEEVIEQGIAQKVTSKDEILKENIEHDAKDNVGKKLDEDFLKQEAKRIIALLPKLRPDLQNNSPFFSLYYSNSNTNMKIIILG